MQVEDSNPIQRIWLSVFLLTVLIVVGAAGLMVLGGRSAFEAIYLTVVILTTVGMEGPNSDAERAWGLFLMIAGVGTVIYATGQLVSFFVEGQIRNILGRRKVQTKINKTTDHFIVIGFGRMGQALCATLQCSGKPFVLIESDEQRIAQAEQLGYLIVQGDAMLEHTLMTAGIERATGMATCLPKDANNVFVTLSASGLNPELHIVSRAEDSSAEAKLHRAGAQKVICPPLIGAARVGDLLMNPSVDDMVELDGRWPDLELSQISAARFPALIGKTIGDLCETVGKNTSVVALTTAQGDRKLRPDSETVITKGDQLVLIGPRGWMIALGVGLRGAA